MLQEDIMKGDIGEMKDTRCEKTPSRRRLAMAAALSRDRWQQLLEEDLTPRQYQLLKMRYIQGMSQRQIAETLGVAISTVSRTLKRAEDRIAKIIRYLG